MTSIDQNYRLRARNRNEADPATQAPPGGCGVAPSCPRCPMHAAVVSHRWTGSSTAWWPWQGGCAWLHPLSLQRPCGLMAAQHGLSSTTLAGARYLIASFICTPNSPGAGEVAAFPSRSPQGAHGQRVGRLAGMGSVAAAVRLGSWRSTSWASTGGFYNVFHGLHCIGVDVWDSLFD